MKRGGGSGEGWLRHPHEPGIHVRGKKGLAKTVTVLYDSRGRVPRAEPHRPSCQGPATGVVHVVTARPASIIVSQTLRRKQATRTRHL